MIQLPVSQPGNALRLLVQQLAASQRDLGLLALGDVARHAQHAHQSALGVVQRRLDRLGLDHAAIGGDPEGFLVDGWLTGGHRLLVLPAEEGRQIMVEEVEVGLAEDVSLAMPEQAFERRIEGQVNALRILQPDHVGDGADQRVETPFAGQRRQFRLLALGDVLDHAVHPQGTAGGIAFHGAQAMQPASLAIGGPDDGVLAIETQARTEYLLEVTRHRFAMVRRHQRRPARQRARVLRPGTENLIQRGRRRPSHLGDLQLVAAHASRVLGLAQQALALRQTPRRQLALGDVHQHADHRRLPLPGGAAAEDLGLEAMPVGMPGEEQVARELALAAQRGPHALAQQLAVLRGDQVFDRKSEHAARVVAENPLERRIDIDQPAVLDQVDAHLRALDQVPEPCLGLTGIPQRLLPALDQLEGMPEGPGG